MAIVHVKPGNLTILNLWYLFGTFSICFKDAIFMERCFYSVF